tara:strand:- start:143 stop:643 length:501 start_codon:yes stop_codon:yes gene_type:complete
MAITIHPNGKIDGINNGNFNSSLPSGHMIQLITSATTTSVNWSSGWTDTGLTANITPQFANSKIIMTVYGQTHLAGSNDHGIGFKFLRGSTDLMTTPDRWQYFYRGAQSFQIRSGASLSYEDTSHNSTSALTYKLQFISMTSANSNAVTFCRDGSRASMQLMEIKV